MIPSTSNRGRPRSARRAEFSSFVSSNGQFTLRDVRERLRCSMDQADKVLRRALAAGEIQPAGTARVDNAKRPVAVYAPASGERASQGTVSLAAALTCWAR